MLYPREGHQILSVEEVDTGKQKAIVKKGIALYRNLSAKFNNGEVTVELREPVIEGSEWQGGLISENLMVVNIFVDNQPAGSLELINGVGSFDFSAVPGTYIIRIEAPLCASAELEVIVSE